MRNADQTSGHVPLVLIARRKIGSVWSAEAERNAETLRVSDDNIGAKFSRRLQQRERQNIRGDDDESAGVVRLPNEFSVIENRAVGRGILHERAKDRIRLNLNLCEIADDDFDPERLRARLHDLDRLRMAIVRRRKISSDPASTA